ncbi:hypothetical protein FOCC_FOCC017968 [Frankliniella occidentalis]|nr:hypothetical protein FOCC_FOCC017968 [Frankliniella occidentalis]
MLGVAGIDVPISDFIKHTMPYSIGVNGYVFIVTNNGYILTHPDHRPVHGGVLKSNYNSVDLSEVEFADEERDPRDPSPDILELREAMVNHSRTHLQVRLKFHFDEMLLVFDARLSLPYFKATKWEPKNRDEEWGDSNNRAIEEPWYVGAVLQHQINNYSFYFSLPPNADKQTPSKLTVTATHAVFHLDESKYVPASVLGYVIPHATLQRRFENVTAKACKTCLPCSSEELNCYLLDSNGYVLASKSTLDTGRFFGEIEGAVLAEMVSAGLFTARHMYDYQAQCSKETPIDSAAGILSTPLNQLRWLWHWTVGRLSWMLLQSELGSVLGSEAGDWLSDLWRGGLAGAGGTPRRRVKRKKRPEEDEGEVFPRKPPKGATKTEYFPCERKAVLYRLEQEKMRDGNFRLPPPVCSRAYSARAVPYSNMLLVVTNPMSINTCFNKLLASSSVIEYNVTEPCQKMNLNDLPRRRLGGCYNQHPKEKYIRKCGNAATLVINIAAVMGCFSILFLLPKLIG